MKHVLLFLFLLLAVAAALGIPRGRSSEIGTVLFPEIVSFKAQPGLVTFGEAAELS
jgi:hypothetical protein